MLKSPANQKVRGGYRGSRTGEMLYILELVRVTRKFMIPVDVTVPSFPTSTAEPEDSSKLQNLSLEQET